MHAPQEFFISRVSKMLFWHFQAGLLINKSKSHVSVIFVPVRNLSNYYKIKITRGLPLPVPSLAMPLFKSFKCYRKGKNQSSPKVHQEYKHVWNNFYARN